MTNNKSDKTTNDESTEKTVDVAPYLSTTTETANTADENSGLFMPFILTLALAVAILVIFYGNEYRSLMAGLGIDIEDTTESTDATTMHTTSSDETMHDAIQDNAGGTVPPADTEDDSVAAVALIESPDQNPDPAEAMTNPGAASSITPPPPAAAAPVTSTAYPVPYPQYQTYAPAPDHDYGYQPASPYPPHYGYYGNGRSYDYDRSYGYEKPDTSASYEEKIEQYKAMLKKMDQERIEARKAYEERMKKRKLEREQARRVYQENLKKWQQERQQEWELARQAYEDRLKNRPE